NPTTYRGNQTAWTMGKLTAYGNTTFTYDMQGRRLTKGDISYVYDSNGNLITQSDGLKFLYDHTGVAGVQYDGRIYLYRKDAQGNIIAILDDTGKVVVRYAYNAWGGHSIEVVDSDCADIAYKNPFRYRGYYYDAETGLYYLHARYYDPTTGRFISPDGIEYLDPESINGLNLYAYCGNDPVNRIDPNGNKWWHWVVGIALVVATTVAMVASAGLVATVIGVSSCVANAMMVGAGIATATAGIVNLGMQASQGIEEFNLGSLMVDMIFSGTVGMIAGGVSAAIGGFSAGTKTVTQLLINRGMQAGANILISSTSYIISNVIKGEEINLYGYMASVLTGFVSGVFFNAAGGKAFTLAVGLELTTYGTDFWDIIVASFDSLDKKK
ncbi:MAG: hypothetical protein J6A38_02990, partial [Clostridia bacterium]|nr:hypothetical protein [Clostridia bacterium]